MHSTSLLISFLSTAALAVASGASSTLSTSVLPASTSASSVENKICFLPGCANNKGFISQTLRVDPTTKSCLDRCAAVSDCKFVQYGAPNRSGNGEISLCNLYSGSIRKSYDFVTTADSPNLCDYLDFYQLGCPVGE